MTERAFPGLVVRERIRLRLAIAVSWLLLFAVLIHSVYLERAYKVAPLTCFLVLATTRAAWLIWRRAAGPLLVSAPDGLTVHGIGRIDWSDIAGLNVRREQFRWRRYVFLDLCIRRPSRYGLHANRRTERRDGFAVRFTNVTWADVKPSVLDMSLRDARDRCPEPFARDWALDMAGSEIHAELDASELLRELESLPVIKATQDLTPEQHAVLARMPGVMRAQIEAQSNRSGRHRRLMALVLVAGIVASALPILMKWLAMR